MWMKDGFTVQQMYEISSPFLIKQYKLELLLSSFEGSEDSVFEVILKVLFSSNNYRECFYLSPSEVSDYFHGHTLQLRQTNIWFRFCWNFCSCMKQIFRRSSLIFIEDWKNAKSIILQEWPLLHNNQPDNLSFCNGLGSFKQYK